LARQGRERTGQRARVKRLLPAGDAPIGLADRVVAGRKHERHAPMPQRLGERIDRVAAQVHVEHRGIDALLGRETSIASSPLASGPITSAPPCVARRGRMSSANEVIALDDEHAATCEGLRAVAVARMSKSVTSDRWGWNFHPEMTYVSSGGRLGSHT
jgi:hypothetical protein